MPTFTAPHVAGFTRVAPWKRRQSPFDDEVPGGVPILGTAGVVGLNLIVEIAWGAQIAADPSTWTWTDVSSDVMTAGGKKVSITLGRTDETSVAQPAKCSFTLDNRSGAYSKGGQSRNYPNVKTNVPVRVRLVYQNVMYTRFYGYAVGFSPDWDHTGNYAIAVVQAEGALRRIQLNKKPVQSTLRRSIPQLPNLVEYWPCEDGALSTAFASAVGGPPTDNTPTITPAAFSGIPSSAPLPTISTGGGFAGGVRPYTFTGQSQIRYMINIPAAGLPDSSVVVSVTTNGALGRFDVVYYATGGGLFGFNIYNADLTINYTSPIFGGPGVNGNSYKLSIELTNSGADLNWQFGTYRLGDPSGGYASGTVVGKNISTVWGVFVSEFLTESGLSAGHITVENAVSSIFDTVQQVNAYRGEGANDRMVRLSSENNVPFTNSGPIGNYNMGYQPIDTYINCMRECEMVDQGMLCDGLNNGLTYFTRYSRTSQPATMTLDASAGDMAMPFTPLDDDFLIRNKEIITIKGGSDYTAEDVVGPYGTAAVGTYDQALTVNFQDDRYNDADHLANWLVHVGTASVQLGYRYPTLPLDLARRPAQIASWLTTSLFSRIDINNMYTARSQAPLGPIRLLVEGWTETFDQLRWNVSVNASSYEPWRVAVLADVTGDTNEFICHLDTDGCVTALFVSAGSSSIPVTITGVTPWTTVADDFPFQVSIRGVPITVTSISALSGVSQTMTVTPATVLNDIPAGSAVAVWRPPYLGY